MKMKQEDIELAIRELAEDLSMIPPEFHQDEDWWEEAVVEITLDRLTKPEKIED